MIEITSPEGWGHILTWNEDPDQLIGLIHNNADSDHGWMTSLAETLQSRGLQLFLQHQVISEFVSRALSIKRKFYNLEAETRNIAAALDRLPTSAIIVSEALDIICVNRQANHLLSTTNTLHVHRNKLLPERSDDASALRKTIFKVITLAKKDNENPSAPFVVSIPQSEKLPLDVLVTPLQPDHNLHQHEGKNSRVLLLIYDPNVRPTIEPELLERIFNLTSTEAYVAARLAEGLSIKEISSERKCSPSTVRTHVKHIFQKTRTSRQGELVQLILTSPAISFG